jgi:nucleoside-diphosphate-sugar epimerase
MFMKTFAVLGGGGVVGYRLCEYLVLRELAIPRPIVRGFRSMARLSRFDLDIRLADACDVPALVDALTGCDVAFHSVVGDKSTITESIESAYVACRKAGVQRLVYLSSAVVHGRELYSGIDEHSPLNPNALFDYDVQKALAEEKLRDLAKDDAVETVVLRPSIVYGPRSTHFTAQVANDILSGRAFLIDGGSGICNSVFIDTLVEVMTICATHPAAAGRTFFVKDGETVTWRQLYAAVADAVGVDPSSIRIVDSAEIRRQLRERMEERADLDIKIESHGTGAPIILNDLRRSPFGGAWAGRLVSTTKKLVKEPAKIFAATKMLSQFGRPAPKPKKKASKKQKAIKKKATDSNLFVATLQMCGHGIPTKNLAEVLSYQPSISFQEASWRTAEWLRFAFGSWDLRNLDQAKRPELS